ncbi:MAG: DUF2878 domain-containing protein [Pseudomonadota bacterium]
MNVFLNFVAFQICWIACVWGGAHGYWWLGIVAVALFAVWEMTRSHSAAADLKLLSVVLVLGIVVDTMYVQLGLLTFATPVPSEQLAPVWIWAMWVSFALTLNHSMAWLKGKTLLAVVFGAIGGPFAYWIAASAWDAAFINPDKVLLAYGVIGVAWAALTPALLKLASYFDARPAGEAPAAVAT